MARTHKNSGATFWNDKHGNFVVWQKPNLLLWVFIASFIVSVIMPSNVVERFISLVGGIAIFVWAIVELVWGVNYFRRTIGLCVLLLFLAGYLF